jgi:hypothetical protein
MTRARIFFIALLLSLILIAFLWLVLARRDELGLSNLLDRLGGENELVVDLADFPPQSTTVADIQRLDTDGDPLEEWIVTYYYDLATAGTNPVAGVIYDVVGEQFRIIYPFPLLTPAGDFLGEGSVAVSVADILGDPAGPSRPEVIARSNRTLAVFRVEELDIDRVFDSDCECYRNPYRCEGFFKGTLRITREGNRVNVWDMGAVTRSQFALRRLYLPSGGSYFRPGTTDLYPPAEASVEFAYGIPANIEDTPYPEKLVLAFYERLVGGDVALFLTDVAGNRLAAGQLEYGSPWARSQLIQVLVQEISYLPDDELVTAVVPKDETDPIAQVQVKVLFVGPGGERDLRQVTWLLVKRGSQWKLHDAAATDI